MAGGAQIQDAPKAMVVVHIDAEALAIGHGVAELEEGPVVSVATAKKIACDGLIQVVTHGKDGKPINVGRASRLVTPRQRRELKIRDRHCRWPGCRRRTALHAHHIEKWPGPTNLDNLVLFCDVHHNIIHLGDFKVRGDPPKIWIERPNLPPIRPGPPRLTR
jgi:uncharacterized protein DUF222